MLALRRLGGRGKDRLWKAGGLGKAFRQLNAANGTAFLIFR